MSELSGANWSETDASNTAAVPDGWPEGQLPSTANNCARAMMGAIKRFWNRINPVLATGGSATAYTLTPTVALAAYVNYEVFWCRPNNTNSGTTPTLNISGLGAKTIKKYVAGVKVAVAAGDMQAGAAHALYYDGTDMVLINPVPFANPMTTEGDLILGGSGGAVGRLAIGSNEQIVKSNGTTASWGAYRDASDTVKGIVELATSGEALAGSDATRGVTSAGLAGDQTKAATGHTVLPGGLILNWGSVSVGAGTTASKTFTKAFTTVYAVVGNKSGTGTGDDSDCWPQSWTTTAVTMRNEATDTRTAYFWAIGV